MEDQNLIFDEFFRRIKELENSNESLQKKISQKKNELSKISSEQSKPKDEEKAEKNKVTTKNIPTEKEDEIIGQKALANYRSIKMNQSNIKNNCVEFIIEYTSQEQHSALFLMGDFTKWEMVPMKKTKDIFTYKVILLKGFKYYYAFQAGDQILLDYNANFEENPKTLQPQNYIDLNEPNKNFNFDSENDINILKITEQNYNLAQLNLTDDEFLFLNKFKNHITVTKQITQEERNKREYLKSSINSYFNEIFKYVNPYNKVNHISQFRFYLKNKILAKYGDNNTIIYYRICNLPEQYFFQCLKLYDCNHIKINMDSYTYSGVYNIILPAQVTSKKIEPNSKLYHLLSLEESQKILDEYNKDDKSIITAYFKTLLNLQNNAINNINNQNTENIYGRKRNIFFVTPKKIEPERINMDDYEFYYSFNRITRIKNKKDSSDVMYKIIDESIEKGKKPIRFAIYYGIINKKIFLIHCHVLDKDLHNIKMIVKDIKSNEDPHVLKKSGEYIKNNQLLLITQGPKILKLYYQGKKVKTLISKILLDKLYLLQSSNPDSIFNKMYVTIKNYSEKIKYDLIEQCNEFTYSFDNMPNGVDVQVAFDSQKNLVIEPMMLSVSPCLLKTITNYDEHILKQKMDKNKDKNKNDFINMSMMNEMERYFAIAQRMVSLRKYKTKENLEKITQEEKNNLIKELDLYKKAMEIILIYIETNEMWENLDEAMSISTEINELIKLINNK